MRVLALVNALFAAALLLLGVFLVSQIGITGLFFLVLGIVFAFVATLAWRGSRAALLLALGVDSVAAFVALRKLALVPAPPAPQPNTLELIISGFALVLIGAGAIAALLDWRTIRQARWFEPDAANASHE